MGGKFSRVSLGHASTRFSEAVTGELVFSKFDSDPRHILTFNAGDIVPIGCFEVLPHDEFECDLDYLLRQTTLLTPTMGSMYLDVYAFEVPNRVVNQSWKTVMGENVNGSWTAPQIDLVPLVAIGGNVPSFYSVPVGSVADHYGFPTQQPIPTSVLQGCHDLKFRGYVEIYNKFFRDQNYQPPIPYSKLNVFEGFFEDRSSYFTVNGSLTGSGTTNSFGSSTPQDNAKGIDSVAQAVFGNLTPSNNAGALPAISSASTFNALGAPLKANKLADYFTTVTPSPQKGPEVLLPLAGNAPVLTGVSMNNTGATRVPLVMGRADGASMTGGFTYRSYTGAANSYVQMAASPDGNVSSEQTLNNGVYPANLYADLSGVTAATLSDLRMAAAVQQVYETMAFTGSRYSEYCRAMFGIDVENPYKDEPTLLGHIRRELDLYQTAQTSASQDDGSPQGNLAAFGYTSGSKDYLFKKSIYEHGYIHILAVVRHRNVYSSFMARDNFRLSQFDFYQPPLANISCQPIYTKQINPFAPNASDQDFGYQEAWAEYRYDPDMVSGLMRPFEGSLTDVGGKQVQSLALWNYADDFNSALQIATGEWIQSNSRQVLDRTLAVTSDLEPQLYGYFKFNLRKNRPMPTYSLPGLDIF